MPRRSTIILLASLIVGARTLFAVADSPAPYTRKFYDDDPIHVEVESQDASKVQRAPASQTYDLLLNQFGEPGDRIVQPAQNTNTIDELPDSSWFTNRVGARIVTADEVMRGPDTSDGPAPGVWTIVASKTEGLSPGFRMRDTAGQIWFVKFDPPGWLEMATGADVVGAKLLHALGYFAPENHIAWLRKEDLAIGPNAKITPPGFPERRMAPRDIDSLLARAAGDANGRYRVVVSKALAGKILGGFRYFGTRPDDPNDLVAHESRRELRALRVFAAWMNHTDTKSLNSMDTVVTEQGRARVRHHLLDFSSTLGSGSIGPHFYPDGWEYFIDATPVWRTLVTLGFNIRPWLRVPYDERPAVGRFESVWFDPVRWKPRVPNAAFVRAQPADLFWGARRLTAFSDELIRAAVKTGRYSDPRDEDAIVEALIARRERIARAWLVVVNPIVSPALDEEEALTFTNAAVAHHVADAPGGYEAAWARFDNATGETTPLGTTTVVATPRSAATSAAATTGAAADDASTAVGETGALARLTPPAALPREAGTFIRVQVRATAPPHPSWREPVSIYFRRVGDRWRLVGLERS